MRFKFPFPLSRDVYRSEAYNEFYCHSIDAGNFSSSFYCFWINFQLLVQFMTFIFFLPFPQNHSASTCGRNDLMFHAESWKQLGYLLCRSYCLMLFRISLSFLLFLVSCSQYRQKDFDCLLFNAVQKGTWEADVNEFLYRYGSTTTFLDSFYLGR